MKHDKLLLNWNIEVIEGSFESQQETLKLARKLSPHTKASHMTIYFARKMLWKLAKKNKPKLKKVKQQKIKQAQPLSNFYKSWEWKEVRYKALARYQAICMVCGATKQDSVITVDHIKPVKKFPHLALDINNLQILCNDCNMGKSDKCFRDWRTAQQKNEFEERLSHLIG